MEGSTKQINTTVRVLEIPLYSLDIPHACEAILDECLRGPRLNLLVSATGAHGLVLAKKSKRFSDLLRSFFLNLPDGMPGVWIGRLKGAAGMKRCYGPDFFKAMMVRSAAQPIHHFFCGGNEGVANELKQAVERKFGNRNVNGTFCPPFLPVNQFNYKEIAHQINISKANVVWIGLSTPKQEEFAFELSRHTDVHFLICVGAAFDFHTDKVKQAPRWIQQLGMEWFFRMMMEPARLFKRYIEVVPMFIFYNLIELVSFARQKN